MKDIILWDIGNVILKPIHGEILNKIFENRKNLEKKHQRY